MLHFRVSLTVGKGVVTVVVHHPAVAGNEPPLAVVELPVILHPLVVRAVQVRRRLQVLATDRAKQVAGVRLARRCIETNDWTRFEGARVCECVCVCVCVCARVT